MYTAKPCISSEFIWITYIVFAHCTTRVHFETDADFVGIKFEAYGDVNLK